MLRLPAPESRAPHTRRDVPWGAVLPAAAALVATAFGVAQLLLSAGAALELTLLAIAMLALLALAAALVVRDRRIRGLEDEVATLSADVSALRELTVPPSLHHLIDRIREQGIVVDRGVDSVRFTRPGSADAVTASISTLEGELGRLEYHRLLDALASTLGFTNPWRR